jgi:hypothetical protein
MFALMISGWTNSFKCHKRPRPTNSPKTSLARPLGLVNSLSEFTYGNESTYSLGITSPKSEISVSNTSKASDFNTPFITRFENAFEGSSIYCNKLDNFEFFRPFPTSCYATPNIWCTFFLSYSNSWDLCRYTSLQTREICDLVGVWLLGRCFGNRLSVCCFRINLSVYISINFISLFSDFLKPFVKAI